MVNPGKSGVVSRNRQSKGQQNTFWVSERHPNAKDTWTRKGHLRSRKMRLFRKERPFNCLCCVQKGQGLLRKDCAFWRGIYYWGCSQEGSRDDIGPSLLTLAHTCTQAHTHSYSCSHMHVLTFIHIRTHSFTYAHMNTHSHLHNTHTHCTRSLAATAED